MKPRGGLSLSTRVRFLWLQTQSGHPESARGLFNSIFLHLQKPCKKGCIPSKAGIHPFLSILMEEAL